MASESRACASAPPALAHVVDRTGRRRSGSGGRSQLPLLCLLLALLSPRALLTRLDLRECAAVRTHRAAVCALPQSIAHVDDARRCVHQREALLQHRRDPLLRRCIEQHEQQGRLAVRRDCSLSEEALRARSRLLDQVEQEREGNGLLEQQPKRRARVARAGLRCVTNREAFAAARERRHVRCVDQHTTSEQRVRCSVDPLDGGGEISDADGAREDVHDHVADAAVASRIILRGCPVGRVLQQHVRLQQPKNGRVEIGDGWQQAIRQRAGQLELLGPIVTLELPALLRSPQRGQHTALLEQRRDLE